MADFRAEEFMKAPDQDVFDALRKEDLFSLGQYLKLTIKRSLRKSDMQHIVAKHLVECGEFDESALDSYVSESQVSSVSQIELRKIEMQEKLELTEI